MNGIKLIDGEDFTATNGSDIVLTTGAALNDIVDIVLYSAAEQPAGGRTVASCKGTRACGHGARLDEIGSFGAQLGRG